ncbi:hypothetical protein ACTQ3Z_01495 [Lawsonibacter sp. LCP25S3_F5]
MLKNTLKFYYAAAGGAPKPSQEYQKNGSAIFLSGVKHPVRALAALAHLQGEKCFSPRTRRGEKRILFYFTPAGVKLLAGGLLAARGGLSLRGTK